MSQLILSKESDLDIKSVRLLLKAIIYPHLWFICTHLHHPMNLLRFKYFKMKQFLAIENKLLSVTWMHQLISKCSKYLLFVVNKRTKVSVTSIHYSQIKKHSTNRNNFQFTQRGQFNKSKLFYFWTWFYVNYRFTQF